MRHLPVAVLVPLLEERSHHGLLGLELEHQSSRDDLGRDRLLLRRSAYRGGGLGGGGGLCRLGSGPLCKDSGAGAALGEDGATDGAQVGVGLVAKSVGEGVVTWA